MDFAKNCNVIAVPNEHEWNAVHELIRTVFDHRDPPTVQRIAHALAHLGESGKHEFLRGMPANELTNKIANAWHRINVAGSDWHDILRMAHCSGPAAVHADTSFARDVVSKWLVQPATGTRVTRAIQDLTAANESEFVVVELGGFESQRAPKQAWAIDRIAPRGEVVLFGGHGGSGKSTLALSLAAHYAAQRPFGPFQIDGGHCAYVSLEDPAPVNIRRLKSIRDCFSLSASDIARNLRLIDGSLGDSALAREVSQLGVRRLAATSNLARMRVQVEGCGLIIVDNCSDAFEGSEIDRAQTRTFVRMLKTIARENDAAVILLAHIDKAAARNGSSGNTYSGSTAWHNSVRSRLALVEEKGVLELRQEKSNLGPKAKSVQLRFTDRGVLVPVTADDAPAAPSADDQLLLQCLADAIARGENINSGRQGAYSTLTVARTLRGFPVALRHSGLFWDSMGRLEESGVIVRERYRNDNRKDRERWIIAPTAPSSEEHAIGAMHSVGAVPCAVLIGGMGDERTAHRRAELAQAA